MKVLQEILVPLLSVNDQSLIIQEISFVTGDKVKKGDVIALLETSKTTYTVEAEAEGYVEYFCAAGEELAVNSLMAKIYDGQVAASPSKGQMVIAEAVPVNGSANTPSKKQVDRTIFSSQALELLTTFKLDRDSFKGYDLVSADDVRKKADPLYVGKAASQSKISAPPLPMDITNTHIEKVKGNKLREISYLSSVQSSGLVSVIHAHIDLENVLPFLEWRMNYFKSSLLPLIIFESAKLLQKYPFFNAFYHEQSIVYHNQVNIGFAVDLDKGLKVVKIANTNKKSIRQIEDEILRLSGAYIDDKLTLEDLTDVTFTITDLSNEGVAFFQPLVNMKNAAILGLSSVDVKLSRATVSLAFDHRVTEGKQAALFLKELKERIESFATDESSQEAKMKQLAAVSCYRCRKTLLDDDSGVGFAKCITNNGSEGYICQACFKGF